MSNAEKFEELLRSNEELQAKLKAAAEAFEGDMTDEAAVFDAVIAPLATEAGVPFDQALADLESTIKNGTGSMDGTKGTERSGGASDG